MVEQVEITDEDSARAWLETQDHQTQVWFAARCAARGLPGIGFLPDATTSGLALAVFRVMLISAGAGTCPPADMRALRDAARSATNTDRDHVGRWPALWPNQDMPQGLAQGWSLLRDQLAAEPKVWKFWIDWYEGLLTGTPMPWPLIYRLADEIDDHEWDKGPANVAKWIDDIRSEFDGDPPFERPDSVPELERKKLVQQVKRLLDQPEFTAIAAEGTAELLDRAITEYLGSAPANGLPEELLHLEKIPPLLRSIATLVKSNGRADAKVDAMAQKIEELNAEVARLEAELKHARGRSVEGLFAQKAIAAAGKAFGPTVLATLGLGISHLFGLWPDDATFEQLRGWVQDLQSATPLPEDGALPKTFDT